MRKQDLFECADVCLEPAYLSSVGSFDVVRQLDLVLAQQLLVLEWVHDVFFDKVATESIDESDKHMVPVDLTDVHREGSFFLRAHRAQNLVNRDRLVYPRESSEVVEDELDAEHLFEDAIDLLALFALLLRANNGHLRLPLEQLRRDSLGHENERPEQVRIAGCEAPRMGKTAVVRKLFAIRVKCVFDVFNRAWVVVA